VSYAVKEIFYTLQGEGAKTGCPAMFCRFAGCNLWPGREADRARAICQFCDTDFVGTDGTDGDRYTNADALHERGFEVAVETNGTIPPPAGLDWVCVSPKAGAEPVVRRGDELKIVIPQAGLDPLDFAHLAFRRFAVQPMDGPDRVRNTARAIAFCRAHPQ
jgi:7-carboxy-7-deazaguanine synthase